MANESALHKSKAFIAALAVDSHCGRQRSDCHQDFIQNRR